MAKTMSFLTIGVWAAMAGSVGAIGYVLHRPLVVAPPAFCGPPVEFPVAMARAEPSPTPAPRIIELEAIIIRATAPKPRLRALPAPPPIRELSEVSCGSWQALQQGPQTQEVRNCD